MLVDGAGNSGAAAAVTGAIRGAAQATGTSFEYLLATAQVESGFNPHAAASTSSAGGLYQFIDQTWLGMLKDAGPGLGYGHYANAIVRSPSGHFEVPDPAMRQEIMALRKDPTANAAMAGAFTQQNSAQLAAQLGRNPSEGELYIAHFLGPAGAAKLIGAAASTPQTSAAAMFPGAASANPSIFYDRQGHTHSVSDVYGALVRRYDSARAGQMANANVALNAPPIPPADIPLVKPASPISNGTTSVSGVAATTPNSPAAIDAPAGSETADPVFHSLFRTEGRRGPVNPVVQELWGSRNSSLTGNSNSTRTPTQSTPTQGTPAQSGLQSLFSDQPTNVRALFGNSA
jgi:hypothetical protein